MLEFRNLSNKNIKYKQFERLYKIIFPAGGGADKKNFELSVVFAPPAVMVKLNKEYRGKKKSANVLSFALDKNHGEVFLNTSEKDLPYLFTHGCLHLLGHDHKKNKDAEKMETLERKVLNNLKK